MGREPRTSRVEAVFFGPAYEDELAALIRVIDTGEAKDFNHPILGTWKARILRSPVRFEADAIDFASMDLEVMEDGTDTALPDLFTMSTISAEVTTAADEVEELDETGLEEVPTALDEIREFASNAQTMAADLAKGLDKVRSRVDAAVRAVNALMDVGNWPLVRALKRASYACQRLANRIMALKPPAVVKQLEAAIPAVVLAHALYKDRSRAEEIVRMNRVRNPFMIAAGTRLKVYAK
jgi:prophage DNA circulation protein